MRYCEDVELFESPLLVKMEVFHFHTFEDWKKKTFLKLLDEYTRNKLLVGHANENDEWILHDKFSYKKVPSLAIGANNS